jgi:iron-sulfur cluster assembly protein
MATVELTPLEVNEPETESEIRLLPAAIHKFRSLLAERNLTEHGLRVFVAGGGCSGMQYGMAIEREAGEFDNVLEQDGIKVFVDPTSMMYLAGSTIDYVDNLMGGGFRIDNPNAVASCGCGHSFRTAGSPAQGESSDGCGHH